jgi:hypothetical protein
MLPLLKLHSPCRYLSFDPHPVGRAAPAAAFSWCYPAAAASTSTSPGSPAPTHRTPSFSPTKILLKRSSHALLTFTTCAGQRRSCPRLQTARCFPSHVLHIAAKHRCVQCADFVMAVSIKWQRQNEADGCVRGRDAAGCARAITGTLPAT